MVRWSKLFKWGDREGRQFRDQMRRFLPVSEGDPIASTIPAAEVTKVALRLKFQIEQVIPCELEELKITKANSPVITKKVIKTAQEAGGKDYQACVVFCLLICKRWFTRQAMVQLWDAELLKVPNALYSPPSELVADKRGPSIEGEGDEEDLLQNTLLKRYSILVSGEETEPANVIEKAGDLHALWVIGSSGYQKCITYLWRGWLVQDDLDPSNFIIWPNRASTDYWAHFNPDRMRAPVYQNAVQIFFSLLFLALYTGAINTINSSGDLDLVEGILYIMTLGFVCDELSKLWKVGWYYIGFWNVFNSTLYALLTVSFVTRCIALSHDLDDPERHRINQLSYNFLAFSAPMFWMRILLYLDTFRFFGAMLVVLKVMMKESLIFFALLVVVCIGFLQAFIGMDEVDDNATATGMILQSMANSVMQSPDFSNWDHFAPPFGLILYYIYTFVVMVILLNILIALYNSAYSDITDNAIDEYMALYSLKTMQFVRAPDENVFIAPFNLIEIFFLILPFEWWLSKSAYERLNNAVMAVIYSPLLLITAFIETKEAHRVRHNRRLGEADDDVVEDWERSDGQELGLDFEAEGWSKKVEGTRPNVETDIAVLEIRDLKQKLKELKEMVEKIAATAPAVQEKDDEAEHVKYPSPPPGP
ncbi:MAG: hypothetical protein MMC33_006678 [Icmadophila ericetorum]|nr:hypothetical protein [Icmadophila ericetorum]